MYGMGDHFQIIVDLWCATGAADVECASCAARVPLPEWKWAYDALGGHRTAHPWGKF
ncbi:hypothetical protein [Streptomyces sp. NPDC047024]|uniref:hypothetical protein n=1 Tax=Streptomyces sp. NPDC047024 TaxID=3155476 RepID=UPI0033D6406C